MLRRAPELRTFLAHTENPKSRCHQGARRENARRNPHDCGKRRKFKKGARLEIHGLLLTIRGRVVRNWANHTPVPNRTQAYAYRKH